MQWSRAWSGRKSAVPRKGGIPREQSGHTLGWARGLLLECSQLLHKAAVSKHSQCSPKSWANRELCKTLSQCCKKPGMWLNSLTCLSAASSPSDGKGACRDGCCGNHTVPHPNLYPDTPQLPLALLTWWYTWVWWNEVLAWLGGPAAAPSALHSRSPAPGISRRCAKPRKA